MEKNYGLSDDQRKGVLIGSLITGALSGMSGKNPFATGFNAYGQGVNALYDQKKKALDAERIQELIEASKASTSIQERAQNLAESKPWGTVEVGAGDGMMQKVTYGPGGSTPMGEKYLQFNPNTGKGADKNKEYRQWLGQAERNAVKGMKFNDPNQLALMTAMINNPEKASEYSAMLERSMTPEQKQQFADSVGQYMETYAPVEILQSYRTNTGRLETKVLDGKRYVKGNDGDWYVE